MPSAPTGAVVPASAHALPSGAPVRALGDGKIPYNTLRYIP